MSNKDKYVTAFLEAFQVEESELNGLKYQDVAAWDSVGHMNLIALLEETFDIMMDTDDIIDLSSFEIGMEILKKYEIEM